MGHPLGGYRGKCARRGRSCIHSILHITSRIFQTDPPPPSSLLCHTPHPLYIQKPPPCFFIFQPPGGYIFVFWVSSCLLLDTPSFLLSYWLACSSPLRAERWLVLSLRGLCLVLRSWQSPLYFPSSYRAVRRHYVCLFSFCLYCAYTARTGGSALKNQKPDTYKRKEPPTHADNQYRADQGPPGAVHHRG